MGFRKLLPDFRFVDWILGAAVVGEKNDLVLPRQVSKYVEGTNLAPGVDGKIFPALTQSIFMPVDYQHIPSYGMFAAGRRDFSRFTKSTTK